jgi:hypothetical protein
MLTNKKEVEFTISELEVWEITEIKESSLEENRLKKSKFRKLNFIN